MEEKIVFRVKQIVNENDYVAFAKKLKSVKTSMVIYLIMSVLMFSNAGIMVYIGKIIEAIVFAAIALIILLLMFFYPSIIGANLFKNYSKLHNARSISGDIIFSENQIHDISNNSRMTFQYYQFEKIIETKKYFFLMITKSSGIILKKECFVNGSADEFKAYFISQTHLKK